MPPGRSSRRRSSAPGCECTGSGCRRARLPYLRRRAHEVLIVHRPAYDDWSFPKGKLERGESDEEAAAREVEEETGLRCRLERELPETRYVDARGRAKTVRYWLMTPIGGRLAADNEIDEARFVPVAEALALLTYERDRELLAALEPGSQR